MKTKKCTKCLKRKYIIKFDRDKHEKNGYRKICKECRIILRNCYMPHCTDCGISLSRINSKRCTICFGKIHSNQMKGNNNPSYKDGRNSKQYFCLDCNKKINKNSAKYGTHRCRSCMVKYLFKNGKLNTSGSNNAMSGVHRFGKDAPNYVHGQAFAPYPENWSEQRYKMKKKYNKCQVCKFNNKLSISRLAIHHIDYNKDNCSDENLICLCGKCHSQSNGNRDYWYALCMFLKELENQNGNKTH